MSAEKTLCFLINDILDLSMLQEGRFKKITKLFDIKKAVHEIIQIQLKKSKELGLSLDVEFLGFDNFKICADQQRFQQVLLNLISNAVKFTKEGYNDLKNIFRDHEK